MSAVAGLGAVGSEAKGVAPDRADRKMIIAPSRADRSAWDKRKDGVDSNSSGSPHIPSTRRAARLEFAVVDVARVTVAAPTAAAVGASAIALNAAVTASH